MLFDDLRQILRSLRRAPGLSIVVVLTAALGIGAGTSLFSVVEAVLLHPLPYPHADRLAWIASVQDHAETRTSMPDFDDWRTRNHSFGSMAAYSDVPLLAGGGSETEQIRGAIVTEEFFDVLGVHPLLGRDFTATEHRHGASMAAVILSHGAWQRIYGGDPQILGRKITVLGFPSVVIGVMPKGFAYPAGAELWLSGRAMAERFPRTAHNYWVIGRLRPDASISSARADLSGIAQRLAQEFAGSYQASDATVQSLAGYLTGSVRTPLLILFLAVGLLLAIVCVNIANLLLVRHAARSGELAVRAALGADRSRLFRHLLLESLMLAAAGGALGLLLAAWLADLLHILLPASIPRTADVQFNGAVAAFGILATLAAGLVFGTLPSWLASTQSIYETLKGASRSNTSRRGSLRTQSALVISEVALSVLLLAGAGLLLSSFARLRAVDPGFRTDHVLAANFSWPVKLAEVNRFPARYGEVVNRVRSIPGVQGAGIIRELPLDPVQRRGAVRIESRPDLHSAEADYVIAGPGTMEALRVPLIGGRLFSEADTADSQPVVIVSREMARRFWPDRDPLGQRMWFPGFESKERWMTVIGVAGDMHQTGLNEPVREQAWVCYSQLQSPAYLVNGTVVVRTSLDAAVLAGPVRNALHQVEPGAAASFRRLDDVLAAATARQRFQLQVLGSFALLALLIAALGIYGVLSFAVASNRRAIGIRMALGATGPEVARMFVRRAMLLVSVGTALGIAGCLASGQLLRKVVFGIGPADPVVLGGAAIVMMLAALAACSIPARRAASEDPLSALRCE